MRKIYILLILLSIQLSSSAQIDKFVKGYVYNTKKEAIQGVLVTSSKYNNSITDKNGFFIIKYTENIDFNIKLKHISYHDKTIPIIVKKQDVIYVTLINKNLELKEVKIISKINRSNTININKSLLQQVPVSSNSGVEQLIKTLPGVSSNNELSSQYSVRAGNFDENLIYINDIEIYRPNLINSGEQEGLSLINPQMVSSINFSPGGFSAKYGDKLSSVLDVKYKIPQQFEALLDVSLLGISALIANVSKNKKIKYTFGFRLKSNSYLLRNMDTKGSYHPYYLDLQSLIEYKINENFSASLWLNYNKNQYKFTPQSRETSFGTLSQSTKLKIYFEGKELDVHKYNTEAISIKYHPNSNNVIKLIASKYRAREKESYDILGEYYLQELFESKGGNILGSIDELGIGRYLNHARNTLNQDIYTVKLKGSHDIKNVFVEWGVLANKNKTRDNINEWQYIDSAGYSMAKSANNVLLYANRKSKNNINFEKYSSYLQVNKVINTSLGELQALMGLRHSYWTYANNHIVSPRATLCFIPEWTKKIKINFSVGSYKQIPNYREMLDINGQLINKVKIQESIHYAISEEYYFKLWNRPFKLFSEIYYKDLKHLIPYDLENVRIRYYGNKKSKAYTYGLDLRLNGEFVKGVESWISLSLLRSKEKISDSKIYTPRPNDQMINFSMFFQDYLPNNPSYTMQLSLHYASGLPVWTPRTQTRGKAFRMPSYRRVDLGISKDLVWKKKIKHLKSLSVGLEIFNLFNINNTVSYLWLKDINNNQYAIPNYLTSRKINLTINASF